MRMYFLALLFGLMPFAVLTAQTSGAGLVSSIEAKAKQILALEKEIENLKQRKDLLTVRKQESIENAKKRLAEAIERTKNEESWKNRLKTAQAGWEEYSPGTCGAGGPPPICRVNHWFRTDVAKAMAKYNEYLDSYLKPYRDALSTAGRSEQNEIDKTIADIDQKTRQAPDLRQQLVDLSKRYETAMKTEADKIAKHHAGDLVRMLSEIHYHDDLIADYDQRISDNQRQEASKKAETIEKVKKQIAGLQKKLEGDIVQLETAAKRDVANFESAIAQYNTVINGLTDRLRTVELQIRDFKGSESQKLQYEEQRRKIQSSIYEEQAKIRTLEEKIKDVKETLTRETAIINQEIFKLKTSESTAMISEAVKIVEEAFTAKRELLTKSKSATRDRQAVLNKNYTAKLNEKDRSYQSWVSQLENERRRVMSACQSVSCNCYGTYVVSEANLAWNKAKDCLANINRVKRANDVLYGCEDMMAHYKSLYNGYSGTNSSAAQKELDQQKIRTRVQNLTGF